MLQLHPLINVSLLETIITLTGLRFKPDYVDYELPEVLRLVNHYQPVYEGVY